MTTRRRGAPALALLAVAAAMVAWTSLPASAGEPSGRPPFYRETLSLLVKIDAQTDNGAVDGTGIIFGWDEKRLFIVTAAHVVWPDDQRGRPASPVKVSLRDVQGTKFDAEVLEEDYDPVSDIAVIAVSLVDQPLISTQVFPTLVVARTDDLNEGSTVYGVGLNGRYIEYPIHERPAVITKALREHIEFRADYVKEEYSGGALINEYGLIVGMILETNFAIEMTVVLEQLSDWGYKPIIRVTGPRLMPVGPQEWSIGLGVGSLSNLESRDTPSGDRLVIGGVRVGYLRTVQPSWSENVYVGAHAEFWYGRDGEDMQTGASDLDRATYQILQGGGGYYWAPANGDFLRILLGLGPAVRFTQMDWSDDGRSGSRAFLKLAGFGTLGIDLAVFDGGGLGLAATGASDLETTQVDGLLKAYFEF
ncbi:trypsin-like peptidase domain-containing protein [bacterium]|nr:trypsin-like peptidase domain-containing protein [bacterium]